jgi:hypothetical protein
MNDFNVILNDESTLKTIGLDENFFYIGYYLPNDNPNSKFEFVILILQTSLN